MPSIAVSSHYFPPVHFSFPAIAFQITRLVESYMIWVGTTEGPAENAHAAAWHGRLTQDWACAMPSSSLTALPAGTPLFRAANAGVALPMAQRLARRFNKQIFLSVDLPPAFITMGQWTTFTLEVEKRAVEVLKSLEDSTA